MRTFSATEYGSVDIPIAELLSEDGQVEIHPSLVGRDFFDLRLKKNSLRVYAGGFIGLVPLNDRIAIDIKARAPIGNLMRVLRLSEYVPIELERFARGYIESEGSMPSMRDVYAKALVKLLEPLETFGLLRDYENHTAITDAPRGRVLMTSRFTQMAVMRALSRAESSWYQRTVDVPANRCIKFALWLLARSIGSESPRKGTRETLRGLSVAYRLFDGVVSERGQPPAFLSDPVVTGRRALPSGRSYYRDALRLAAMISRDFSLALDREGRDLRMMPLLVDMDVAFENYIRTVLRESSRFNEVGARVLDGNREQGKKLLFDDEPSSHAQPDIVVTNDSLPSGRALIVADVKYKPARGPRPDRSDLNQVITYGASYRCPRVLIVQPRAANSELHGLRFLGRISKLEIYQFVFDLNAEELEEEEKSFSGEVAKLFGET